MNILFKTAAKSLVLLFFLFNFSTAFTASSTVCMGVPYCANDGTNVCYSAIGGTVSCGEGFDAQCSGSWAEECCAHTFGEQGQCVPIVTPPDVCIDENATNHGGPAPCEYGEICNDFTAINYGGSAPCRYQTCNDPRAANYGQVGSCIPVDDGEEGSCACISAGVCITEAARCAAPVENCGDGRNGNGEQCDLGGGNGPCPRDCSSSCQLNTCGSCQLTVDGKGSPYFSSNPADMVTYANHLESGTCYTGSNPVNTSCINGNPTGSFLGTWRYLTYGHTEPRPGEGVCNRDNNCPGCLLFTGPQNPDDPNDDDYYSESCARRYSCSINNNPTQNGICGSRNTIYSAGVTSYPVGSAYCAVGSPTATPAFPANGTSVSWFCSGAGGGTPSLRCTAVSVSAPQVQFSVNVQNPVVGGFVSSNDGGIGCGTDCSESYNSGFQVVLKAEPSSSYWRFSGWAGDCSGLGQCSLNVNGNKFIIANFSPRVFNYEEF